VEGSFEMANSNFKVGIKFRPALPTDGKQEAKWKHKGNKVESSDEKFKFTFGESLRGTLQGLIRFHKVPQGSTRFHFEVKLH
jgi:hypothetical protein